MTLAEQLFLMMQKNSEAQQPTDLVTGTVTSAAPLEITVNTAMAPLKAPVLLLTESVVENGASSLEIGDKVLLLRVQHGQKFIVLSRAYSL